MGLLALWLRGGLLSLCGALGYAELATTYPEAGGDYAFLTRAYGRWAGFLFGWIQLAIVRPGDIVVMAFAFAMYAVAIHDPVRGGTFPSGEQIYATLAVIVLTGINILGVRQGKWTQNLLTAVKVAGLGAIVILALLAPAREVSLSRGFEHLPLSLGLILVLFTFGGWNEIAYVAAEVVHPERNIVRALLLGTAAVTILYLLVNGAYLHALGYEGLAASPAVAAQTIARAFPDKAPALISGLVCISALGAANGLILTGARISYAVGRDHRLFRPLGQWNANTGTPVRALLVQSAIAVAIIVLLGSFLETILYTAAPVYLFLLATTLAVIVLRRSDPTAPRPCRVPGYPLTPLIFSAACAFLAYSAMAYKPWTALAALGIALAGLPLYWVSNRLNARSPTPTVDPPLT
jgi:amino acid transporter